MKYDPEKEPDAVAWLSMDEDVRISLAEEYHRVHGITAPNVIAHAAFHCMVENQIAEGLEAVVRATQRLQEEGLSRHEAIHAVGSIAAELMYEMMKSRNPATGFSQERYVAAIAKLTAASWRQTPRL